MADQPNDPILLWPNLANQNLMAQLNLSSKGVPTLLLRPLADSEDPEVSAKRAQVLDNLLQKIVQQVNNPRRLSVRLIGGKINAAAGEMINTPAKMAAFLNKAFPRADMMEMRLSEIRQEEAIRQAAMAFKAAQTVAADTPFNLDALNKAIPDNLVFTETNGQLSLAYRDIPENPLYRGPIYDRATNEVMVDQVKNALNVHWNLEKADQLHRLTEQNVIERAGELKRQLQNDVHNYWEAQVKSIQVSALESWRTELLQQLRDLAGQMVDTLDGALELKAALKNHMERLTFAVDNQIINRMAELDKQIAQFTGISEDAGSAVDGDTVWDNVQDIYGSEEDSVAVSLGVTRDGVEIFENGHGARFKVIDDAVIWEGLRTIPGTVDGRPLMNKAAMRSEDWLTLEESLGIEPAPASLEQRIRSQFIYTVAEADQPTWQGLTVVFDGHQTPVMIRAMRGTGLAAELQMLSLEVSRPDAELRVQLMRLTPENRLLKEGLAQKASETVLKNWAKLGLPLPEGTPSDVREAFDGGTVEPTSTGEESDNDTVTTTAGDERHRRDGVPADSATAADTDGQPSGVPASDGSRRDADDAAGVSGTDSAGVSNDLAGGVGTGGTDRGQTDQAGERVGAGSGDESAGDQRGAPADAEPSVRGDDGVGNRGTGHGDTGDRPDADGTPQDPGLRTAGGTGAGVPGAATQTPEERVAEGSTADRSTAGSDRPETGVSDDADGGSERPAEAGDGAVSGGAGGAGSPDGDAGGRDLRPDVPEDGTEAPGNDGSGADSDPDGAALGSGTDAGRVDWERFADESSDQGTERPEPLSGDLELEQRTPAVRLSDNLEAIRLLAELNSDPDAPTSPTFEERQILARFSGFGGIHARMFQRYMAHGVPKYVVDGSRTLEEMAREGKLTASELESIRSTILNAHYTHSGLIGPMWEAMDRMGLPLGRVLEPSCGILNFKAFMPESVAPKVKTFTGVEIDPLTARMAQAAHPDATVINRGFEKTQFPDGFFDAVISNVPFGDYKVFDPEHPERKDSIHNAFFLKALDKVRPGGVVAFVTSSYVMDSSDTRVREKIMDRAHVMGAFRMPDGTFKQTTGTEVVTDVIFLQKKGNFTPTYEPLDILDTQTIEAPLAAASPIEVLGKEIQPGESMGGWKINALYAREPDRVLGEPVVLTGPHGPELVIRGGGSVAEQRELATKAFALLPENVSDDQRQTTTAEDIDDLLEHHREQTKELHELPGALSIENDQIMVKALDDKGKTVTQPETSIPKNMRKRATAAILTMIALSDLLDAETQGTESDEQLNQRRADVDELMAGWEKLEQSNKAAFSKAAWKVLNADPRGQRMQFESLYDKETRALDRPDIVKGRTIRPMTGRPTEAKTLEDALAFSLAYTATVSETYILSLLKESQPDLTLERVRDLLVTKEYAFVDPQTNELVERSVYLSGNLRPKIDAIEAIIEAAPEFQRNLDALESALPAPLSASQIKVSLDAFWLPEDVLNEFLSEAMGIQITGHSGVRAYFDDFKRHWRLQPTSNGKQSLASIARAQSHVMQSRWGTERRHAIDLLENAFTHTIPVVRDKVSVDPDRWVVNAEETLKAQAKYEEILDAFDRWVYKDPERAQRLIDIYNSRFNATVLYEPDGSHMVFPGMADHWVPLKHQSDFIWRSVSGKNAMTAHCVGAGKTLQLIGTAIRGKQMGRFSKPLIVVPNHMLEQFANDGQSIYPNAKILVMTAADARAVNRPGFAAKAAMGDWDMIVCTHSVFEKITVPREFEALIIERELAKFRATLEDENAQKRPKEIEKEIKKLEERLERTIALINKGQENVLNLEEIGIDFIGVDEAHYYKNLMVDTAKSIPGVSNTNSARAMNMLIKCQYMRELHGDCYGIMMATGTPISNSMIELYTFTRMLRPDLLEESGIQNFNDWMGLFGEVTHGMEIKPEGGGYQIKSRLARFKNIPELIKQIRTFIDFKTAEDLDLPSPKVNFEVVSSEPTEFMAQFMKYIEARAKLVRKSKNEGADLAEDMATEIRESLYRANDKTLLNEDTGEVDPDDVEMPSQDILLTIATDGRKASLDPRMIHPKFEDSPNSKVNKAIKNLLAIYRRYDEEKALQLVFCDFSSPTGKGIFNVYADMKQKLMAAGIPESEIAFIHDAKTDAEKEDMFARARSGEIRFLFGSTQKMGVGTNVQDRLVALHDLDPPWRPSDLQQRLGRMERQGNLFDDVYAFRYVTVDSFDLFMYSTLDRKLKLVTQAMRKPEDCVREIDEEAEPSYEDIMAATTGNEAIKEFMEVRQKHTKYKRMLDSHVDSQADIGGQILAEKRNIKRLNEYLQTKLEEQALVQANQPMALTLDCAVPKLCDGPMAVTGGLKNLARAIEQLGLNAPRYRTTNIGTFGGLNIKIDRMGSGPTVIVERGTGHDERLITVSDQSGLNGPGFQQSIDEGADDVDEYYMAAKALVRFVRKIGNDNGIDGTKQAIENARRNLANLEADHGAPFAYEAELARAKERLEILSAEVGDALDEDKPCDPLPLVEFAQSIHKHTQSHSELVRNLKSMMPGMTLHVSESELADDVAEEDDAPLVLTEDAPGDDLAPEHT